MSERSQPMTTNMTEKSIPDYFDDWQDVLGWHSCMLCESPTDNGSDQACDGCQEECEHEDTEVLTEDDVGPYNLSSAGKHWCLNCGKVLEYEPSCT